MFYRKLAVSLLALGIAGFSQAEGFALGVHAGTAGLGASANLRLNDNFALRGVYNQFSYDYDTTEEDLDYEGEIDLKSGQLGIDYYPFAGRFRVSAAYVSYGNEINLTGVPNASGEFEINGTIYTSADIGSVKAKVDWPSNAVYAGLGWGNPVQRDKGFGLTFDVGVMLTEEPQVDFTTQCFDPLFCALIEPDVEAERQSLEEDLGDVKMWPVIQLGLSYQF